MGGGFGRLGHGGQQDELGPRLVQGLTGKKVVGASAGAEHTAVWTDEGEVFTFGKGYRGKLGHGGIQHELVPRLVSALAGKTVIGASAVVITQWCGRARGAVHLWECKPWEAGPRRGRD